MADTANTRHRIDKMTFDVKITARTSKEHARFLHNHHYSGGYGVTAAVIGLFWYL